MSRLSVSGTGKGRKSERAWSSEGGQSRQERERRSWPGKRERGQVPLSGLEVGEVDCEMASLGAAGYKHGREVLVLPSLRLMIG